jgi:hypothetical protein
LNLTKSIFSVILFLVLLIIIPVQLFGQVLSESISVKGHWNPNNGGIPSKVIVQNNIAYIGAGKFLLIFDISDTSSPQYLSSVYFTNDVNGLDVDGNYAYVTAWWAGLSIIDVSDLNNPQIISNHLSTFFTGDLRAINGVEVVDTRAYLFDYELEIVDISDPYNPLTIGSYFPEGNIWSELRAYAHGDYIYVSNHSGLRIIDFENASNPQVIGEFFIDSLWNNLAIVADGRAYLSLYKRYGSGGGGLSILDISTPQNPIELSRITTSELPFIPTSISLLNNHLFLGEREVYEPYSGKLKSYNVTDPYNPCEMDQINLPSGISDISSRDGICYSADSDSEIMLVDITDVNNLTVINSINTNSGLKHVIKSDIANNLAAVALGYKGIEIIDISNLAEPYSLSSMKFDGYTSSLKISNNYLYLNDSDILRIVNISNPQQPNEISSLGTGNINDMEINDGYLLICSGGMKVVDISSPIAPQIVGEYLTNSYISRITVVADYAYLLSYYYFTYGIHIVDISEPTAPYLVGTVPLGTNEYSQLEINN